jgi:hypothetical protein
MFPTSALLQKPYSWVPFPSSNPSTQTPHLSFYPLFLPKGKDLVSEQTLQIQETSEAELWGTGKRLPQQTALPGSLLSSPSIPVGSTQGRNPDHWWLWQQLWSLVPASLPKCVGFISDDVSLRKGWPDPGPPAKPRTPAHLHF